MQQRKRLDRYFSQLSLFAKIVGTFVIWVVIGDLLIGVGYTVTGCSSETSSDGKGRHRSPVYAGMPAEEFWVEHNGAFESWSTVPYYMWRRRPFQGTYTNVDEGGIRRTIKSPKPGAKMVVVLGGSTTWGTGAPDAQTVPSWLQAHLGDEFDVHNWGESSYVTVQSLNFLLHQLAAGARPDIVISYDGVNDLYAGAYSPAIPRDPCVVGQRKATRTSRWVELFAATNYKRLADSINKSYFLEYSEHWDESVAPHIDTNVEKSIDMYDAYVRQVQALAEEYGFQAHFFWQPSLFATGKKKTPFEESILQQKSKVWAEAIRTGQRRAKDRLSGREHENVYYLGDVFDDRSEDIFIDQTHIGPQANDIIAQAMMRLAGGKLRDTSVW